MIVVQELLSVIFFKPSSFLKLKYKVSLDWDMSPVEMKELPKESEDEVDVAIIISDDDAVEESEEPEPLGDPNPEPELVDVENEDEEDIQGDEEEDEEELDEEDNDDDEEEESSEGGKEEDDDSDDEDDGKGPFNDSDDDDDNEEENRLVLGEDDDGEAVRDDKVEDEEDEEEEEDYSGKKRPMKHSVNRGKVMPGVSFPLSSKREYKGDIEDLLRAAAQAEEGETSARNNCDSIIDTFIDAASVEGKCKGPHVTIKENEIECTVVDIIDDVEADTDGSEQDGGGIDEEENISKVGVALVKTTLQKENYNVEEGEHPPVKRMKSS